MNRRNRTLLIILISALLVSILFNIRSFITIFEELGKPEVGDVLRSRRIRLGLEFRMKFAWFNLIIEFVVFTLAAYFNYKLFDKLLDRLRLHKMRLPSLIAGNLILYFTLILPGKAFHKAYFAPMETLFKKEIDFDIQNFLIINISVFLLAILVATLLNIMRKMHLAEAENIRLAEEKSRAELSALKEQISPHFFFNTLSSLSTVVRNEDKEVALNYIGNISNTYRYTLSIKDDLVTVKEEMDFLDSYLYLLKERFGSKLKVETTVPESCFDFRIPPMSLQLLVENAIQHNIIIDSSPLTIRLMVEADMICIENNLQEKQATESFGLGLKNLGERYQILSGREIIIQKEKCKFIVKLPLL